MCVCVACVRVHVKVLCVGGGSFTRGHIYVYIMCESKCITVYAHMLYAWGCMCEGLCVCMRVCVSVKVCM